MNKIIKVGTIVKVKSDLTGGQYYDNLYFANGMEEFRGQELEVVSSGFDTINNQCRFTLKGSESTYTWNLSMIEEVSEEDMEEEKIECRDCCGEFAEEDMIYLEHYDNYVCQECYDRYYRECEDCGEMIHEDDLYEVHDSYGGIIEVCDNCRNNYYYCEDCEEYYSSDTMYQDDYGNWYCEDCWENNHRDCEISGYHDYHRGFNLIKASGEEKVKWYLGTESEMENSEVVGDCVRFLKDNFDAILSKDGSLDGRGAMEWVDDARSMKAHYEIADLKRKAFEMLVQNGYRSHDTNTCGLHIHASRPYQAEINKLDYYNEKDRKKMEELQEKQESIIDRIILVMETYKQELIKFSRRKDFGWCKWLSDVVDCDGRITSLDYIKKVKGESMGHHRALNLENRNTIEFRIFKGTLNFDTYMASLELVNNIMELCSDLDLPLEKITWKKLTRGQYVTKYVEDNNIHTTRKVVDTSASDRIWEKIRNKRKAKVVKKILEEMNKYYTHYTNRFNKIKNSEDWRAINNIASRLAEYSSNMYNVEEYKKNKDYNGLYYKFREMINYNMYFDNDKLETIKDTLKELVKGLQ